MARVESRYVCQSCGAVSAAWEGRCHVCGTWDSLVETLVRPESRATSRGAVRSEAAIPRPLGDMAGQVLPRVPVGIGELDRVLGGGLVPGAIALLGGEPGIGKSTLVLELAAGVAAAAGPVLVATGEESAEQLHLRADRLGLATGSAGAGIHVLAETSVDLVLAAAESLRPGLLVVDSVQTVTVDGLDGPAGSVGQVREAASRLAGWAHATGTPVVLVGHVTKDGSLAGPRTLEHLVDVVLTLEGDRYGGLRLLRSAKNRFGSTEETGVLEMTGTGLRDVPDPARAFLGGGGTSQEPGVIIAATMEGTRPVLVEVQALVAPAGIGVPRRALVGLPADRLALLVAVMGRRCGLDVGRHDLYLSLAGGATVDEPALDLPVALALASTARDLPVDAATVACGEVTLLGGLRPVRGLERRVREAARLGFRRAIVPAGDEADRIGRDVSGTAGSRLEVVAVPTLREALAVTLGQPAGRDPVPLG
ncbi:MAG: DNA repair protein RadA [Chloroflexi bacterium]|nr:DNA repair protein RadA [Chloroflexota bacterium]